MTRQRIDREAVAGSGASDPHARELLDAVDELLTRVAALEGAGGGRRSQFFRPQIVNTNRGLHTGDAFGTNDLGYVELAVPDDFGELVALEVLLYSVSAKADANADFFVEFGGPGEAHNQHTAQDTTSTYDIATNILFVYDITALGADFAPGDLVGLKAQHVDAVSGYLIGARLVYDAA